VGDVAVRFDNRSSGPATAGVARVVAPHTWAQALTWINKADFGDPNLAPPDWLLPLANPPTADAGASATSVASLEPGSYGVACEWGTWPKVRFTDGGAFEVKG
jgi:hypothetical protein